MPAQSKVGRPDICLAIWGGIFLSIGVIAPIVIACLEVPDARHDSALTKQTESTWTNLPGELAVRQNYVYNVINKEDVMYKGAKPIVQEMGPYHYVEDEAFENIQYGELKDNHGDKKKAVAFGRNKSFHKLNSSWLQDAAGHEKTITAMNPASQAAWMGEIEMPAWRLGLNTLYEIGVQGLGAQSLDASVANAMLHDRLALGETSIDYYVITKNKVTAAQRKALWNDPVYGMKNISTLSKWFALTGESGEEAKQTFTNEIRTYFNLSFKQISEAAKNMNSMYNKQKEAIFASVPTTETKDLDALAYWQWASSLTTGFSNYKSITELIPDIVGYPEINYYMSESFMKTIADNAEMTAMFKDAKLIKADGSGYEHLFRRGDLKQSLFNMVHMKELLSVGQQAVDVTEKKGVKSLDLSMFTKLTKDLGLDENRQTYLIFLWMKQTISKSIIRHTEGGSEETAMIAQSGAHQLADTLLGMTTEVPVMVYTYQLIEYLKEQKFTRCDDVYSSLFGITDAKIQKSLCEDQMFGFLPHHMTETAKNLITISIAPANVPEYVHFQKLTGMTDAEMVAMFASDSSKFVKFMEQNIMNKVFDHYKDSVCKSDNQFQQFCSFEQLAIGQWLEGAIMNNPTPAMPQTTKDKNMSYQKAFPMFSKFTFTPELSYFTHKSGLKPITASVADIYQLMTPYGMFSQKFNMDLLINANANDEMEAKFAGETVKRYLKFAVIEGQMGGLFTDKTPKQLIEGYDDEVNKEIAARDLLKGGNMALQTHFAINQAAKEPIVGQVFDAFFTGSDSYKMTRSYARVHGSPHISVKSMEYTDNAKVTQVLKHPWADQTMMIEGTDGSAFRSDIQEHDKTFSIYSRELARPLVFKQEKYVSDIVPWVNGYKYVLDQSTLKKGDKFATEFDGTSNLASVKGSSMIATQAHFYGFDAKAAHVPATIVGQNMKPIKASKEDESYFVADELRGVAAEYNHKIQNNFHLKGANKDGLFSALGQDAVVPFSLVSTQFKLDNKQGNFVYNRIITQKIMITCFASIGCGIGLILLIIYACQPAQKQQAQKVAEEAKEKLAVQFALQQKMMKAAAKEAKHDMSETFDMPLFQGHHNAME